MYAARPILGSVIMNRSFLFLLAMISSQNNLIASDLLNNSGIVGTMNLLGRSASCVAQCAVFAMAGVGAYDLAKNHSYIARDLVCQRWRYPICCVATLASLINGIGAVQSGYLAVNQADYLFRQYPQTTLAVTTGVISAALYAKYKRS